MVAWPWGARWVPVMLVCTWAILKSKFALRWTPAGKRKRGTPKITWRKTVETELSEMGLSWGEAHAIAKDKTP